MMWLKYRKPGYGLHTVERTGKKWALIEQWGDDVIVVAVGGPPITRDNMRWLARTFNNGHGQRFAFSAPENKECR